jgi:hypothetical protein
MACDTLSVVVKDGVLYEASGFDSWCVILKQWLLIVVWIAEQVIVNDGEFYCVSGFEL